MGISLVQSKVGTAAGTDVTATFDSGPAQGNLLIAIAGSQDTDVTMVSSGWTAIEDMANASELDDLAMWAKIAGVSESSSVTIGNDPNNFSGNLAIYEWNSTTGWQDPPKDVSTDSGTTTDATTSKSTGTTATTAQAEELVMAAVYVRAAASAESWTNSFTARNNVANVAHRILIASKVTSATGTQETTASWTTAGKAWGIIATFKTVASAQIQAPNATVSTGNWRTDASGTDLHTAIDEAVASDTDYIQSGTSPASADICEIDFPAFSDPASSAGHKVKYRYKKSATGGDQINLTVRLRQESGTTIATWTHTNIDTVTTATQTLTSGEADAITNYGDLRLRFEAIKP